MKSIPPMNELFNMAGMNLPEFLGKDISPEVSQKLMETYDQKMIEAAEEADQNSDS
jgi:flotillin